MTLPDCFYSTIAKIIYYNNTFNCSLRWNYKQSTLMLPIVSNAQICFMVEIQWSSCVTSDTNIRSDSRILNMWMHESDLKCPNTDIVFGHCLNKPCQYSIQIYFYSLFLSRGWDAELNYLEIIRSRFGSKSSVQHLRVETCHNLQQIHV